MTLTLYDAARTTTRKCGDCQLCCKLLPVRELQKGAGQRCEHQKAGKGCLVYHRPGMPHSCALWNCRWLMEEDTADLSRPDRSHYVIDVMPDYVRAVPHDGQPPVEIAVLQVWVDPKFPNSHRDPALRAYLQRRALVDGMAALIRYDSSRAFLLLAPPMTGGQWVEFAEQPAGEAAHSGAELWDYFSRGGETHLIERQG